MASAARNESRHYGTIVIGAGMSGLSCAGRLLEHRHYKEKGRLLVLEARDRIGGRIYSTTIKGSRLDLGANWIHGIGTADEPNPLMNVLPKKRYKQLAGMIAFKAPDSHGVVEENAPEEDWIQVDPTEQSSTSKKSGSDRVIPVNVAGPLMAGMWTVIGSLHELASEMSHDEAKHTTMLQAIAQLENFREVFKNVPQEYHSTFSSMPQFVENMEAGPLVAQSAEHPKGQVGMGLHEFSIEDFDGDQVFLQDGYTPVIEEVAKDLVKAGLIELGAEVEQIDWSSNPIAIKTSGGSFTARRVVCSVPLGVLQHHANKPATSPSFFEPPLPSERQEAIQSLGFGTLDKIFAIYQNPWWEQEPYWSILKKGLVKQALDFSSEDGDNKANAITSFDTLIGFTNELPGLEIHADGTTTSGNCILSVMNHHNLTGYPVLCAFISCSNATQVEAFSDEQAAGILHRALTTWIGREPPKPEAVHVTRWSQDEFSRGSYSHMITDLSETRHREVFQQPLVNEKGGELRFAGEHTSRNHFATVHGALLSGWREADDILKDL